MKRAKVTPSSGNIFADLGFPDPETHRLKAEIVIELNRLVNAQKLTQTEAGACMGISQPEVSRLFRGHYREYSVERLMTFLTTFNREVEIVSRPAKARSKKTGRIRFTPEPG